MIFYNKKYLQPHGHFQGYDVRIGLASLTRVFFHDDPTDFDDVQLVLERKGDVW